jgi:hypothetical protein
MAFNLAARLIGEVLPLGRTLHGSAIRDQVNAVARRLEGELGPERYLFTEGCQRDWEQLPRPDLPLVVGLDGGYVHSSAQTCIQTHGHAADALVTAGRPSVPASRTRVLNDDLAADFARWYPGFTHQSGPVELVA